MNNAKNEIIPDIICEFLEVAFNAILFVRGVYPDGIFRQRRKCKVAVAMNCHPELNKYIKDVLIGLKTLLLTGNVESVSLQINSNEGQLLERFTFEMLIFNKEDFDLSKSQEIEDHLRDILLKINTCDCELDSLPTDCSFSITVQTKASVASEITENDSFQEFPWIRASGENISLSNFNIIPLKSCITDLFNIQCFIEKGLS